MWGHDAACLGVWVDPATDRVTATVRGLDWAFRRAYLPRKRTRAGADADDARRRRVSAMLSASLAVRAACDLRRRTAQAAAARARVATPCLRPERTTRLDDAWPDPRHLYALASSPFTTGA